MLLMLLPNATALLWYCNQQICKGLSLALQSMQEVAILTATCASRIPKQVHILLRPSAT